MKRWMILMGWIMMSCMAFSQTLKPTVLTVNLDTNFCFTIPQSKIIANYIVKGQFADSLEVSYEKEINDYKVRFNKNERIIDNLNLKNQNQGLVIDNKSESIEILTEQLKIRDKQLRRAKWQKILFGTATVVMSVAIILK